MKLPSLTPRQALDLILRRDEIPLAKRLETKHDFGTHAHQMALYLNDDDLGFGIDHGIPTEGVRYGGDGTIHNTGDINIVMDENGVVTEVWFRCQMLSFTVSSPKGFDIYGGAGAKLVAVEVVR